MITSKGKYKYFITAHFDLVEVTKVIYANNDVEATAKMQDRLHAETPGMARPNEITIRSKTEVRV